MRRRKSSVGSAMGQVLLSFDLAISHNLRIEQETDMMRQFIYEWWQSWKAVPSMDDVAFSSTSSSSNVSLRWEILVSVFARIERVLISDDGILGEYGANLGRSRDEEEPG